MSELEVPCLCSSFLRTLDQNKTLESIKNQTFTTPIANKTLKLALKPCNPLQKNTPKSPTIHKFKPKTNTSNLAHPPKLQLNFKTTRSRTPRLNPGEDRTLEHRQHTSESHSKVELMGYVEWFEKHLMNKLTVLRVLSLIT